LCFWTDGNAADVAVVFGFVRPTGVDPHINRSCPGRGHAGSGCPATAFQ
jgi:hypothetical protein